MFEPKKRCTKCGQSRYEGDFSVGSKPDGRLYIFGYCKECERSGHRRHYHNDVTAYRGHARTWRAKSRHKVLIGAARKRADKAGLAFDLDQYIEEIGRRFAEGCELTGYAFELGANGGVTWNTPSIDRIKPELGYVYSNIRIICWGLNAALGNWGEEQTAVLMRAWLDRRNDV